MNSRIAVLIFSLVMPSSLLAQQPAEPAKRAEAEANPDPAAITRSVELLLSMQEPGDANDAAPADAPKSQWPYEGVYRVRGEIPIGYRVGGTAISAMALLRAPGYAEDQPRRDAVSRALAFITSSITHPLMSFDNYDGGYDVRAWGYCYGLALISELRARELLPAEQSDAATRAADFFLSGITALEIPQIGGWNYARPPGRDKPAPQSPFMTGATLQAIFAAKSAGMNVDAALVERALAALERGRGETGTIQYSGDAATARQPNGIPGATGRMLITESTLYLAGRSDLARVRSALDAFFAHWDRLDERRAKPKTHEPPFGVAPYYFYFAHHAAAQAIELLPERDRPEYRKLLRQRLYQVRLDDGSWNDRVFPRSANYGTACALMALAMPNTPKPAGWTNAGPAPALPASSTNQ